MGKGPENDQYLPCLKCGSWVPGYAKEIHSAECHELMLKSFSHPFIIGSSLFTHVTTVGTEEPPKVNKEKGNEAKTKGSGRKVKKSDKKGKGGAEEGNNVNTKTSPEENPPPAEPRGTQEDVPDWLKKIFGAFRYRIVLLNERDLARCDVTAYSPVLVEYDQASCAFLAIPDEDVRIGHAKLHYKSSELYLPAVRHNSPVWIKKINNVEFADEVELIPSRVLAKEEVTLYAEQVKSLLYSNFSVGAPFTLCVGSKVYLPSPCGMNEFEVVSYKLSIDSEDNKELIDNSIRKRHSMKTHQEESNSTFKGSESMPSEFITLDECGGSDTTSLTNHMSKLQLSDANLSASYVTVDEVHEGDTSDGSKISSSFITSTPKRFDHDHREKLHSSLLISLVARKGSDQKSHMAGLGGVNTSQKDNLWFRIRRNTNVVLQPLLSDGDKTSIQAESVAERDRYCEDSAYVNLKKIMHSKLTDTTFRGNPLLGGWGGVLLYGPPGTGKSLMVRQAAAEEGIPLVSLTLTDVTQVAGTPEEWVRRRVKLACDSAPCVLFLDEVDSLCPAGDHRTQKEGDLTSAIVRAFQTLQGCEHPVVVVGASSRPQCVHPRLCSSGRLDREVMVPLPDALHRVSILQHLISGHHHSLRPQQVEEVARKAYGFSGADLSVLLRCAWLACVARRETQQGLIDGKSGSEELCLSQEDLLEGVGGVVPTMLRHHHSAITLVRWSEIWGYQSIKTKLQTMVMQHTRSPQDHPLRGVLLYGPPGCSKTMIVRALATETGFTFFTLKCSDLLSKYVGETEKSLSRIFVRAQQAAPALIFMDEVDSLCGDRGGSGAGGGGTGLLSELLTLITHCQDNVMVMGATNRPHALDEALLRPGFLEQVIHVGLPDGESREEMWRGLMAGVPTEGEPVDLVRLSEASAGYSGAEIKGIYQEAAHSVISQLSSEAGQSPVSSTTTISQQDNQASVFLSQDLLLRTIQATPPRTPPSLLDSITSFTKQRTVTR